MLAYLIDPTTQSISSLSIDTDDYARIRRVIGCRSLSVAANLPTKDIVFVGRTQRTGITEGHFFRVTGCPQRLAGRAVVVGCDHVGDSVDARTSANQLRDAVTYENTYAEATS